MDLKAHARHSLQNSRRIAEGVVAALKTPDDWFYQVHPQANHPLWIVGHLGWVDNRFVSRFRPQLAVDRPGWSDMFGMGSKITTDREAYPAPEEVVAYFRDRRVVLLKVLDEVSEAELNEPVPAANARGPLAGAPSVGHIFLFAAMHEGMHAGQLTVAHRGLGHPPLVG